MYRVSTGKILLVVFVVTFLGKELKLIFYECVVRWIEGDAIDLPFDDCEFDAITMGYGLRNVVDRLRAMKEMYRVLKPGLCFFVVYLIFSQGFF